MQCDAKRQDGAQCEDDFGHYGSHVWPEIKFAANVTLRDYFAAAALPELMRQNAQDGHYDAGVTASEAYDFADAMLKARQ